MVLGDTGRVSMELALLASSRSLTLLRKRMWELSLIPRLNFLISTATQKEVQPERTQCSSMVHRHCLHTTHSVWLCPTVALPACSTPSPSFEYSCDCPWKSCAVTGVPPPRGGGGKAGRSHTLAPSQPSVSFSGLRGLL